MLKYLKLSIIFSLLPIFMGCAMQPDDANKDDEQIGQVVDNTASKKLIDNIELDYNLLGLLPREIFHLIMMLLYHDSSFHGLRYCYKGLHIVITQELAESYIQDLWEKMILSAESLDELNQKVNAKSKSLSVEFPNHVILYRSWIKLLMGQIRNLNENNNDLLSALKSHIMQKNWFLFDNDIHMFKKEGLATVDSHAKLLTLKAKSLILKNARNSLKFTVAGHIVRSIHWKSLIMANLGPITNIVIFANLKTGILLSWKRKIFYLFAAIYNNALSLAAIKYYIIEPKLEKTLYKLDSAAIDIHNAIGDIRSARLSEINK